MKPLAAARRIPLSCLAFVFVLASSNLHADTRGPAESADHGTADVPPPRPRPTLPVAGMDVRTSTGRYIGSVRDIVVNRETGAVAFFLVAGGKLPTASDTVRLVPAAAIEPATFDSGLSTSLSESDWQALRLVAVSALAAGINRSLREPPEETNSSPAGPGQAAEDRALIRGAELRGRAAATPDGGHGRITDLLVDFRHGIAVARLSDQQAGRDYALRVDELELPRAGTMGAPGRRSADPGGSNTGPTRLAAQDAPADALRPGGETPLSPAGRPEVSPIRDFDRDPALQAAARAVRQAWDADPILALLDLHVTPEKGRLVIRGTVPDADSWGRGRDSAKAAAGGTPIEERVIIAENVP